MKDLLFGFAIIVVMTLTFFKGVEFGTEQETCDYKIYLNKDYTVTVEDPDGKYLLDSLEQLEEFITNDNI